ncbi:MAG: glycosyl transferase [Elusimicrobia bacterium HGW-Elusimicrobia-2]|nr:MAG: glycosyl transferase [Elusimicrobia bacterium HGW-Elusimicrobia-2]
MKISVIIPFYNERKYLRKIIEKVMAQPEVNEIIAVNDGSNDGSLDIIKDMALKYNKLKLVDMDKNSGKGTAVRAGLRHLTGDIVIIQDADLEYNPEDYPRLLKPFNDPTVQVVYGSRILHRKNEISYFSFSLGGLLLTGLTNILYNVRITDEPTGYKVFKTDVFKGLFLCSRGFEFCPEVTAKIIKSGIKIHEVPISYSPRKIYQGKKIRFSDGIIAIWTLLKYRLS